MALFMNQSQHPGVYMNTGKLIEPNQEEFRKDYLTELLEEQQASNKSIHQAINSLRNSHKQLNQGQLSKWKEVNNRLTELKELHSHHEKKEVELREWLKKLQISNDSFRKTMKNEHQAINNLMNQIDSIHRSHGELSNQLNHLEAANDGVVNQLEQVGLTSEQLISKIDEQWTLSQQMAQQISTIENNQIKVLHQVDNQEGIMEKIIHQIDNVRFILFERTNFLDNKIEKVIEYIQKIKNKKINKQMSLVMTKENEEEE